ncbi:MAG TPA: C4-type zinc ribbon domain-containing protein [Cytophagales bacterium]|nr:C4-type zinc ribbon domain-containing protein [Cytophagales bacterium]
MEFTTAQKLESLFRLQQIDSKLDDIKRVRGDLPEEIRDLEDEIAGLETRISKYKVEIDNLNAEIDGKKNGIKESEKLIKKYEDQQSNVRNNREFDAISKEMELQTLEIELLKKKIKESQNVIELKKLDIDQTKAQAEDKRKDLDGKKAELKLISEESTGEENRLIKDREKAASLVEERLLTSYNRIRNSSKNGLAVVSVKRDACGGCFNTVPPQRQADIKDKKKIIVCEHCGRILADVEMPQVVEEPAPKRRSKIAE